MNTMTSDMKPPTAQWMGMDIVELDTKAMTCTVTFAQRPEMQNFGGVVQGGIISAMLDDAMGFLAFVSLNGKYAMGTIDLHTQFFKAVPMDAHLVGKARVVKSGNSVIFTEAFLYLNGNDEPAARATASQKLRAFSGIQFDKEANANG